MKKKFVLAALVAVLVAICAPAIVSASEPVLPDPTSGFYTTYENSLAKLGDFNQISYNASKANASVLRYGPVTCILCYKGAYQTMVFMPTWRVSYKWVQTAECDSVRFKKLAAGGTMAYITAKSRPGFFANLVYAFTNFSDPPPDTMPPVD